MIKVGEPKHGSEPINLACCVSVTQAKHRLRQREGHHTPDWDALSDLMRSELIYREVMREIAMTNKANKIAKKEC